MSCLSILAYAETIGCSLNRDHLLVVLPLVLILLVLVNVSLQSPELLFILVFFLYHINCNTQKHQICSLYGGCLLDIVIIFSTFCCSTIKYIISPIYTIIIDYSLIYYSIFVLISFMANQTSNFTDTDKAFMVQQLSAQLNSSIFMSFLHGIYIYLSLEYLCLIAALHRHLHWSCCSYIGKYL